MVQLAATDDADTGRTTNDTGNANTIGITMVMLKDANTEGVQTGMAGDAAGTTRVVEDAFWLAVIQDIISQTPLGSLWCVLTPTHSTGTIARNTCAQTLL